MLASLPKPPFEKGEDSSKYTCKSLKAALLLRPRTTASLVNISLRCRDCHRLDEENRFRSMEKE